MKMFLHIGKGKTGTTFLQDEIYSKHKSINYIAKSDKEYPNWLINWHYADDFYFDLVTKDIKSCLNAKSSKNKIDLISSEAFSIVGNLYHQSVRIKQIVPNAKIIITLRDPIDAILSFYKYSVQEDCFLDTLENSIDWNRTPMAFYKRKAIYIPDFYYDEIIKKYIELFGKENVCVLKYEDMINETEKFFVMLSAFMGIKLDIKNIKEKLKTRVNISPKENDINSLRRKNLYRKINNEFPKSSIKLENIIVDNHSLMNDKLRKKIIDKIKGKCFGYY